MANEPLANQLPCRIACLGVLAEVGHVFITNATWSNMKLCFTNLCISTSC